MNGISPIAFSWRFRDFSDLYGLRWLGRPVFSRQPRLSNLRFVGTLPWAVGSLGSSSLQGNGLVRSDIRLLLLARIHSVIPGGWAIIDRVQKVQFAPRIPEPYRPFHGRRENSQRHLHTGRSAVIPGAHPLSGLHDPSAHLKRSLSPCY